MNRDLSTPRIVVGTGSSGRPGLVVLVLTAALLIGAGLGYGVALYWAVPARAGDIEAVQTRLQQAQEDLARLQQELAIARRGSQVTEEANETLRGQIFELEQEIAGLESDVAFYRRLLGTGGSRKGLAVHALQLMPTASSQVFRYQLTLSQNLNKATVVDGRYQLNAEGLRNGEMVVLDAETLQLKPEGTESVFEFKYFQQLAGSLRIPEGFEPVSLIVRLRADSARQSVERRFEWSELLDPIQNNEQEELDNVQSEG